MINPNVTIDNWVKDINGYFKVKELQQLKIFENIAMVISSMQMNSVYLAISIIICF